MKQLFLVIFLSSVTFVASCQNAKNYSSGSGQVHKTITADEFDKKLSANPGVQLVDVRTHEEFAGGHLKGAVNINVNGDSFDSDIAKLDKKKPVMVYCRSGKRSANACGKMKDAGFVEIYNMDGGITSWGDLGKPVEKGN